MEPAEGKGQKLSKGIAYVLDDLIKIPGTDKRIGLDPIIGLIPGAGDFLSSGAGLAVLAAGAKRNIPKSVYLRMISNWGLNALLGAVPVIGDAFSFWFKSNRRNYELMQAYAKGMPRKSMGWWPLMVLVTAVVIVVGMFILITAALAKYVFS